MTTPDIVLDEFSRPYWEGLREHRLRLQWCTHCDAAVFYPRALCPRCHRTDLSWVDACGRGHVYSYTVVRKPTPPYGTDVPFAVALVELEERVRMLGRLVGVAVDEAQVGLPVTVGFGHVGDLTVVEFSPTGDEV